MRPRIVRRISRSAAQPPRNAPASEARLTYSVADTPAWPWPMLNMSLSSAGIQSFTTQPGERRQREAGDEQEERAVRQQRLERGADRQTAARRTCMGVLAFATSAFAACDSRAARGVAEQEQQRDRVDDADDAGDVERQPPAEIRRIRHVAAEAADDDAAVDRDLVQPDRARARAAACDSRRSAPARRECRTPR